VTLLRRTALLGLGDGLSRVLGLAAAAVLARVLGVADFGVFSSAMSLALVVSVAIDFGQNILVGRLVAHDRAGGRESVIHVVVNKVLFTLAACVTVPAIALALGVGREEGLVILFLILWGGGLSVFDSLRAVARSTGHFAMDSTANGLESCLRIAGIIAIWLTSGGMVEFAAWFALEAVLSAVGLWVALDIRVGLPSRQFNRAVSARLLKEALPIGIASLGLAGFYRLDQVLVRGLAGPTAAGLYGAAARLALSASVVGMIVMMAAFPDLVRAKDDPVAFRSQALHALRTSFLLGLAASAALFVFAQPLVLALYGRAYSDSVYLLRVLSLVVVLNSVTVAAQQTANALGRESRVAATVLVLAVAVVAINALLIPVGGATAAAWVSVVAEAVMALGLIMASRDRLFLRQPGA